MPYYGEEYEDAYIFTAYTRHIIYNKYFSHNPFQTQGCVFGSLSNCLMHKTYGGHLIGLPSLAYLLTFFYGYSPSIILIINLISSLFGSVLVYSLSYLLSRNKLASLISSIIYCVSPVMTVFHTSGLSETLSSTTILLTVLFYVVLIENKDINNNKLILILWLAFCLSFTFSILQKRENLILFFLPLLTLAKICIDKEKIRQKSVQLIKLILLCSIIVLVYYYFIDFINIEKQESHQIGTNTFSIKYFNAIAPIFAKAFFTYKWFYLFSNVTIFGIIILLKNIFNNKLYIYPLGLFTAFFLAYTLHYRGYYFTEFGDLHKFDALRYITNLYPFYCIITGYAIYYIYNIFKLDRYKTLLLSKILIILVFIQLFMLSNSVRNEFYNNEKITRMQPIRETIANVNECNSIIITEIPLLFQVICCESLFLIDLQTLSDANVKLITLKMLKNGKKIFYLKMNKNMKNNIALRWPDAMEFVESFSFKEISSFNSSNYKLLEIVK